MRLRLVLRHRYSRQARRMHLVRGIRSSVALCGVNVERGGGTEDLIHCECVRCRRLFLGAKCEKLPAARAAEEGTND